MPGLLCKKIAFFTRFSSFDTKISIFLLEMDDSVEHEKI